MGLLMDFWEEVLQDFEEWIEDSDWELQIETGPRDEGEYVFSSTMPSELCQDFFEGREYGGNVLVESDIENIGIKLDDELGGLWRR